MTKMMIGLTWKMARTGKIMARIGKNGRSPRLKTSPAMKNSFAILSSAQRSTSGKDSNLTPAGKRLAPTNVERNFAPFGTPLTM